MITNPQIAHQIHLEKLYSKNQTIPRINKEFMDEPLIQKHLEENNIPIPFGVSLLTQMALHKRCNLQTLVGTLRHYYDDAQQVVDMILKCVEADLVDWSPVRKEFIVRYTISADVQEELDKYQFPLPMVVRPLPVCENTQTGYVTGKGSIILKRNHHEDDVCLDHINRMNCIKFVINHDTATMIKNSWRNLDKPKAGETRFEFEKRKRAFDKYDRTAHHVIGEILQHGNEFYLTHKYDKRGRVYCQGYHVNYQGNAWNKAVVELAEKELVQ